MRLAFCESHEAKKFETKKFEAFRWGVIAGGWRVRSGRWSAGRYSDGETAMLRSRRAILEYRQAAGAIDQIKTPALIRRGLSGRKKSDH
jgi:hypothetical protein